ncbi:LPD3 domain-containing protein [Marinobacterium jannaschii]|uniref:LPD3 domain-containing protein n=1 Tax=Marinobacterium jannaschii TaxID=64970 RepID=UPI000482E6E0|nr:hypothetical protein [Marinobacterium jannaschii]
MENNNGIRIRSSKLLEEIESTVGDAAAAAAQKAWIESPTSSISRYLGLESSDRGRYMTGTPGSYDPRTAISNFLDKEAALSRVQEAGVELSIPDHGIREPVLDLLIERKRDELKRQSVLSRAPDGLASGSSQLGAALAASLADPINIAASFIPVVGQARYARMLSNTSTAAGRLAVRAKVGALEGAVGAAIVEPVVLGAATAEQADYDLSESLNNIGFGVVLGAGLHSGVGAISDALRKTRLNERQQLAKAALAQAIEGRPIDVRSVAAAGDSIRAVAEPRVVSRLSGDEVLAEGVDSLEAARGYFQTNLQGNTIIREGFGEVRITGKGWKKVKAGLRNDPLKAQLIPAIPDIIKHGEYKGRSELYKDRSDDIQAFHRFEADVEIGGRRVLAGVTVAQDRHGRLFYNMNHNPHLLWQKRKPQIEPRRIARESEASAVPDGTETGVSIDLDASPLNMELKSFRDRDAAIGKLATLERGRSVTSKLADKQASSSAQESIKEGMTDDTEQILEEVSEQLQELAEAMGVDVAPYLKPFDESIDAATSSAKALRAAAICALRKN